MKLEISRRAARRLHEIADYIHRENPSAALHVQRTIRAAFALLATYPDAGRVVRPKLRRFVVPRLPYLIYYTVDETIDAVIIVTIRHAAQRRQN
ncbi:MULTISPECIES: type II toxin-antitoxin system RelE/ParE family toxin [Methylorubrum]|jgi:plasmid stabilization system protein ParE|uniref:Plasmid stabilization system n=1 Tax=Methylorubrum populi (strain ATCC BAA-705 / NCIMB 13946 / BJ001) TaxID=441620 RepID=B1ZHC2_METPB|nr:type II toxin-antitoxin system RelE/ParE family toxin [Methylorubrum populi]ACB79858.1 plasmid stabilization system [Methylorubrum populi BJ001]OAH33112.1 plasmid stabilization system [Methylorubrum populi]PZP72092.1 MAG: type II toxin-antitoxin system RelE/ParE family toxin [Methylorubrum populi]